jgi:hypothetical protein
MGPRLYWAGSFNLCTVLGTKQWDHGTKFILWRLFQFVHRTRYKVLGPLDQHYIGEAFPICSLYYVQSVGTMGPRLYLGGSFNSCTELDAGQWDHGTKIILRKLCNFVHCTTYKAIRTLDQDYIWKTLLFHALYYEQSNGTMGPRLY